MKVLIVDDEPLVRRSLERVFTKNKHQVETAENGLEGVKKWKLFQPDLVFLDVLMPGLSGPEVLEKMKSESQAKIIMMSAFTGDRKQNETQAMGAHLFLAKPFEDIFKIYDQAVDMMK